MNKTTDTKPRVYELWYQNDMIALLSGDINHGFFTDNNITWVKPGYEGYIATKYLDMHDVLIRQRPLTL